MDVANMLVVLKVHFAYQQSGNRMECCMNAELADMHLVYRVMGKPHSSCMSNITPGGKLLVMLFCVLAPEIV